MGLIFHWLSCRGSQKLICLRVKWKDPARVIWESFSLFHKNLPRLFHKIFISYITCTIYLFFFEAILFYAFQGAGILWKNTGRENGGLQKKFKIDLISLYIHYTNTFSQFPNHFLSLTTQVVGYQGKQGKGVYGHSSLNQWKQLCIHFKFTNYVQHIKKWAESQEKKSLSISDNQSYEKIEIFIFT